MAGYETTSYALAWTLMLLAQHPSVQAELREELSAALGGEAPTVEQLAELPLLDAVVKESTRLLPPTYMMFIRRACGPFELGPFAMPEGTRVVLSPLVSHHMPEVFSDPDRFVPKRWFERKPDPFELVPFGAGPRLCLGAGFAAQEIRLVVALILQRFSLRMPEGARLVTTSFMPWPTIVMHNVWILPGVPKIFAMKMKVVAAELEQGTAFLSEAVYTTLDEGNLKPYLDAIVARHPGVDVGSYPQWDEPRYRTKVTFDAQSQAPIEAARDDFVASMPAETIVDLCSDGTS